MKDFAQAHFIQDYDPEGQWIQVFPSGEWYGHDGRGVYKLSNPEQVVANSYRPKTDLNLDRDHERFFSDAGTQIKAAGWFKKFEVRDGEIWAFVTWTPSAKKELAAQEYRYFSPEFDFIKETGEITAITGGSLTNDPNFELQAVASKQSKTIQKETHNMDQHIKKLAKSLGLPETATTEQVQAAAQKKLSELDTAVAESKRISNDLEQTKVAASKQAQETGQVDPSQYVPIAAHNEVASQLKELQTTVTTDKAETAVAAAMEAGKVSPAQKKWATDYATKDPAAFKSYLENAPEILSEAAQAEKDQSAETGKMTSAEAAVASQLGMSEEDFLGTATGEKEAA